MSVWPRLSRRPRFLATPRQQLIAAGLLAGSVLAPQTALAGQYWSGLVDRYIESSPHQNEVAVAFHNAYIDTHDDRASNTAATKNRVSQALNAGADLIELDLRWDGNAIQVDHDASSGSCSIDADQCALLNDILSYTPLWAADAPLFMEIKYPTVCKKQNCPWATSEMDAMIRELFDAIEASGYVYATEGRPLFLRTFVYFGGEYTPTFNTLLRAKQIAAQEYPQIYDNLRTSALMDNTKGISVAEVHDVWLEGIDVLGVDMVEFHLQDPHLGSAAAYAHDLGLGVGVYTVDKEQDKYEHVTDYPEIAVATLREFVDVITVEPQSGWGIGDTQSLISEDNAIAYFDTQFALNSQWFIAWIWQEVRLIFLGSSTQPDLLFEGPGEDRYGGYFDFNGSGERLPLTDDTSLSSVPGAGGYLVSALVNFDDVEVPNGSTQVILGNANAAGFSLEVHNPSSVLVPSKLRFAVHINGAYRYAEVDMDGFNGTDAYQITGAYDGDGYVRLWVNNGHRSKSGSSYVGAATLSSAPATVGADPQGTNQYRFYFDGKIQNASVLAWKQH